MPQMMRHDIEMRKVYELVEALRSEEARTPSDLGPLPVPRGLLRESTEIFTANSEIQQISIGDYLLIDTSIYSAAKTGIYAIAANKTVELRHAQDVGGNV